MGHAENDFLDTHLATALENLLHGGDQAFTAIEAETLDAREFSVEELLKAFRLDQAVEDRLFALFGEVGLVVDAFDAFLDPGFLVRVLDVHELDADGTAVGLLKDVENFANGRRLEAEHVVDENLTVHVLVSETVGRR